MSASRSPPSTSYFMKSSLPTDAFAISVSSMRMTSHSTCFARRFLPPAALARLDDDMKTVFPFSHPTAAFTARQRGSDSANAERCLNVRGSGSMHMISSMLSSSDRNNDAVSPRKAPQSMTRRTPGGTSSLTDSRTSCVLERYAGSPESRTASISKKISREYSSSKREYASSISLR